MINNTNNEIFKRMIIENKLQNKNNNNIITTTNNEEQEESGDTSYCLLITVVDDIAYLLNGFTEDRLISNTIVYYEISSGKNGNSNLQLINPITSKVSDITKKEIGIFDENLPLTSFKHIFYNAAKNRLVDESGNINNIPMMLYKEYGAGEEVIKENGIHISEPENDIEIYILGLYIDSDDDLGSI